MASAVLRKYASIRAVDLIQQKIFGFLEFFMNLMEARFEFSMRVCYKVKVDIHTLSDTVDRENFAAKIISRLRPTVKI